MSCSIETSLGETYMSCKGVSEMKVTVKERLCQAIVEQMLLHRLRHMTQAARMLMELPEWSGWKVGSMCSVFSQFATVEQKVAVDMLKKSKPNRTIGTCLNIMNLVEIGIVRNIDEAINILSATVDSGRKHVTLFMALKKTISAKESKILFPQTESKGYGGLPPSPTQSEVEYFLFMRMDERRVSFDELCWALGIEPTDENGMDMLESIIRNAQPSERQKQMMRERKCSQKPPVHGGVFAGLEAVLER